MQQGGHGSKHDCIGGAWWQHLHHPVPVAPGEAWVLPHRLTIGLEGQVGLLEAPADASEAVTKQHLQDLRTAQRSMTLAWHAVRQCLQCERAAPRQHPHAGVA
jgi:hypothetical protein